MATEPASPRRDAVRRAVHAFYDELPFNFHGGVESSADAIRANPIAQVYPDLDALLRTGGARSALELGCGAGWLSNTLADAYGIRTTAVDLCGPALERARSVALSLGVEALVDFHDGDLFEFTPEARCELVISMGVLHHTGDAEGGVRHAAACVADGGHVYLGLYHEPGRRPFLDALRGLAQREGEEAAFERYRALDGTRRHDETLLRSWFRDQVLHPHETQHTLREVAPWLEDEGLSIVSTSLNRFEPIDDLAALFERELTFEERSRRALEVEGRYFPGFFTVMARRPPRP